MVGRLTAGFIMTAFMDFMGIMWEPGPMPATLGFIGVIDGWTVQRGDQHEGRALDWTVSRLSHER